MRNLAQKQADVKTVSKADQIRQLDRLGHSPRIIAEMVLGLPEDASYRQADRKLAYIRAVLRQRIDGRMSDAQRRYEARPGYKSRRNKLQRERYASDPEYAERRREHVRRHRQREASQ